MSKAALPHERKAFSAEGARREQLINEFAHVIRAMAHRLAFRLPAYLDAEDLISVGTIGLMDAMTKYDPTREAKFKTYAEFRIRGAMLDEIRAMDWIPRSVHERISLLQKTHTLLMSRLGRPPHDEEVATELKMSLEELDEFITRARGAVMLSVDDLSLHEPDGHKAVAERIAAIRSRKTSDLTAEILEGHLSAGLVHTGNISYRLGALKQPGQIKEAIHSNKALAESFDRMAAHLDANGVDIATENVQLGVPLKFDPKKERFTDNDQAN